mmetsp:Transcript_16520/g.42391  ORF Transcript_16520/g.42391 Transcript_16520/m.42391 type:complete len:335 (-) Transcript_16520:293-1297(-)
MIIQGPDRNACTSGEANSKVVLGFDDGCPPVDIDEPQAVDIEPRDIKAMPCGKALKAWMLLEKRGLGCRLLGRVCRHLGHGTGDDQACARRIFGIASMARRNLARAGQLVTAKLRLREREGAARRSVGAGEQVSERRVHVGAIEIWHARHVRETVRIAKRIAGFRSIGACRGGREEAICELGHHPPCCLGLFEVRRRVVGHDLVGGDGSCSLIASNGMRKDGRGKVVRGSYDGCTAIFIDEPDAVGQQLGHIEIVVVGKRRDKGVALDECGVCSCVLGRISGHLGEGSTQRESSTRRILWIAISHADLAVLDDAGTIGRQQRRSAESKAASGIC